HEGSLVATTDSSGGVTGMDLLTPYGQAVSNSTSDFYLYTGLDQDAINGSDHAWYRNYSTAQSRWLRPDPYNGSYDLYNPQSFNRYNYVENNPLTFTDPSGLSSGWATGMGGVCKVAHGTIKVSTSNTFNPCDPAAYLASAGIYGIMRAFGFSGSINEVIPGVAAAITIACSINDFNNAACGPSGWASVFIGGNTAKVINDTFAAAGAAAATMCAIPGADAITCEIAIGYAIYAAANDLFSVFWDAFGPAQFTGSLLPRPADLSGLGTSKIGIPNQNLSIRGILGQPSSGVVPSPGIKLP
ncbi:MAG: hypothetical protein KIY12_10400, partial [Thermoplasmata archaeon]|nr:hypothetical protein [Candidatus Sysuiplasma superficiale]